MTTAEDVGPIQLLPTGEVAVEFTSGRKVLPRPTFGQIQPLIRAEGRIDDELTAARNIATVVGNEILAQAKDRGSELLTAESLAELEALREKSRASADELEAAVVKAMTEWWGLVLDTLLPGAGVTEDQWPSVFMDPKMPGKMVAHWRFVPAGPG